MQRIAFQLRICAGREAEYDQAHRHVWPELLRELADAGVQQYSIFRRGQQLFLYMLVPDFSSFLATMAKSNVNQRWQQTMAPLFEPVPSLAPGEPFAMMQEVFFMPGHPLSDTAVQAAPEPPADAV